MFLDEGPVLLSWSSSLIYYFPWLLATPSWLLALPSDVSIHMEGSDETVEQISSKHQCSPIDILKPTRKRCERYFYSRICSPVPNQNFIFLRWKLESLKFIKETYFVVVMHLLLEIMTNYLYILFMF